VRRHVLLTRRPTRWSLLVPVVGILAGALFATSSQASESGSLRSTATGLPDIIRERTSVNERLTDRLTALQAEVDALTKANAPGSISTESLTTQADGLAEAAGRTAVHGPMIQVTLTDSPLRGDQIPAGLGVDSVVVHQQDVEAVVNALWRGGAEAMMLQDQRVIGTSAVRCVGNTLILQGRVYSPPYVIKAIGSIDNLEAALANDPQIIIYQEYVAAVGLGYQVSTQADATFPPFEGSIVPKYASAATP
jgi:uncharacterized protein YlxW (UPF0749 family)